MRPSRFRVNDRGSKMEGIPDFRAFRGLGGKKLGSHNLDPSEAEKAQ